MKFLCTHCERLISVEDFRVEGEQLAVRCRACGGESKATRAVQLKAVAGEAAEPASLAPSPPAAAPPALSVVSPQAVSVPLDSLEVPEGHCPKCVAPRAAQGTSCPQCGLVYDNFTPAHFELSAPLEALWRDAVARDGEEQPHRALIELAHQGGELPLVARLYRIRLARNRADAVAQRWCEEVVRIASSAPLIAEAPPDTRKRLIYTGTAIALFLAIVAWLVLRSMKHGA